MGIADKFLNARVKLDMTVEEFSQLTTILTVVAMESQNFDKETARKVLDYQSSFLALLTAVLNSSEDAQKFFCQKQTRQLKAKFGELLWKRLSKQKSSMTRRKPQKKQYPKQSASSERQWRVNDGQRKDLQKHRRTG